MGEDVVSFNKNITSVIGTISHLQGSQCESDDGYEEAQLESSSEAGEAELVESSDESFTKCVRQQQANQDRSQQACMLVADNDDVNEMSGKASDWIVGQNMGTLLRHPDKPLGSQAQALVANVYANVRSLPVTVLKAVLNHPSSVLTSVTRNFADYVAAHLLGLGRSCVRGCWGRLRCQDMQPRTPDHARKRRVQEVDDATKAQHPHNDTAKVEQALAARIRECLAVSYRGFPDVEYQRRMHSLALAGLYLGSKYNSIKFVQLVEALAMQATRSMTADALNAILPGLGIPSDMTIMWDGVSIGASSFSRHETLLLIGANYMCQQSGRLKSRFLAAPSLALLHDGAGQMLLLLRELQAHPARLTQAALKQRVVVLTADGAGAKGGEHARHSSTAAAEKCFQALFPETPAEQTLTEWDLFHRIDIAVKRATSSSPAALEVFDVSRVMGALFGNGDGRVILRGVAPLVDAIAHTVHDQGGTRKVVALGKGVANLLCNFRACFAGMHARLAQSRGPSRRGSQRVSTLVDVGRRLAAVNFVTFTCGIHDVMRKRVLPLALLSEKDDAEALGVFCESRMTLAKLLADQFVLSHLRRWLFVTALLGSYVALRDLQSLWRALAFADIGNVFPSVVLNMHRLLWDRRFQNCSLSVDATEHNPAVTMTLSPRCQCLFMQAPQGPHRVQLQVGGAGHRTQVTVPAWVACSRYNSKDTCVH